MNVHTSASARARENLLRHVAFSGAKLVIALVAENAARNMKDTNTTATVDSICSLSDRILAPCFATCVSKE
jgi:hypothetical protein